MLVPNPFYRMGKAPFWTDASTVDFGKERAKIGPLMGSVTADGNAEKDAIAYIEFLDEQKQVNKSKKIGTQGYCMGGGLVMRTAATVPDRVGAGGSFHGGGLVTDKPNSPHLLAPKIKAKMYFGIAHERRLSSNRTRRTSSKKRSSPRTIPPRSKFTGTCLSWLVRAGYAKARRWHADL